MSRENQAAPKGNAGISMKEFFEKTPPGSRALVAGIDGDHYSPGVYRVTFPVLELYCNSEPSCDGIRLFEPHGVE